MKISTHPPMSGTGHLHHHPPGRHCAQQVQPVASNQTAIRRSADICSQAGPAFLEHTDSASVLRAEYAGTGLTLLEEE